MSEMGTWNNVLFHTDSVKLCKACIDKFRRKTLLVSLCF